MKRNEINREVIPGVFKLFGQNWKIRYGNKHEMDDNLGLCQTDDFEILIQPGQTEESMTHTLLHELCHSIEQKLHLNLTEAQVDLMALGLLNLLRDNPDLLKIFKEIK